MSVLFVAEIGSCHKGIKSLAFEMIRQASKAGADIAKFQLGWPKKPSVEHTVLAGTPYTIHNSWSEDPVDDMRYAPMEWVEELASWCKLCDIEFMASIWSMEGLEAARSVGMERYKIAAQKTSGKVPNDVALCNAILEEGKETFVSLGTAINPLPNLRRIFTVSEYPAYQLSMPESFGEYYGYSSHSHGIGDALVAVARGAKYVEKHVTLDKTEHSIRDNHFALDFVEFAQMVECGREMERFL